MMQSVEILAEPMNDVYAADGGYASNRPSMGSSSFPSSVPETITQGYDADGGYQYWKISLNKWKTCLEQTRVVVMEPKKTKRIVNAIESIEQLSRCK